MGKGWKHFILITKHRHQVIRNGFHMGIFWKTLGHDLSKYGREEFHHSKMYFTGKMSPVFVDRMHHDYYSRIATHHTKRNKHHWEYWTDFLCGRLIVKTIPYRYAVEYVCDVLAASKVYNGKAFQRDTALRYFNGKEGHYYMTQATKEFVVWCLSQYAESGWKHLKKKETKAKYEEIIRKHPDVEVVEELRIPGPLPPLDKNPEEEPIIC